MGLPHKNTSGEFYLKKFFFYINILYQNLWCKHYNWNGQHQHDLLKPRFLKLDLSYDIPRPSENKNCQAEFETNPKTWDTISSCYCLTGLFIKIPKKNVAQICDEKRNPYLGHYNPSHMMLVFYSNDIGHASHSITTFNNSTFYHKLSVRLVSFSLRLRQEYYSFHNNINEYTWFSYLLNSYA